MHWEVLKLSPTNNIVHAEVAAIKKQMDEEIAKNKKELEEMQKSWEQKVKDLEAQRNAEQVDN